jgi:GNAT superfamily N-acetyltransferase
MGRGSSRAGEGRRVSTRAIAGALQAAGVAVPAGHALVSFAERPELIDPAVDFAGSAWPEFMRHDPVAGRLLHHLWDDFPAYQLILLDPGGAIAAIHQAMPLAWDGTDAGLPVSWDDQLVRTADDLRSGRPVDSLGAIQIVSSPSRRGDGLAGLMLTAMRANARLRGFRGVIACVRPTLKHRYPLVAMERYARWLREDGLPFDPWIRLHVRLGGRVVGVSPQSMTITGSVAEWEAWTGLRFPESGSYVVEEAQVPVDIDSERDLGAYADPGVWVVHDLRAS